MQLQVDHPKNEGNIKLKLMGFPGECCSESEWGASLTTASIPINEIVMPQHTFPSAKVVHSPSVSGRDGFHARHKPAQLRANDFRVTPYLGIHIDEPTIVDGVVAAMPSPMTSPSSPAT